jgi:hypothetical protein
MMPVTEREQKLIEEMSEAKGMVEKLETVILLLAILAFGSGVVIGAVFL